jgi:hypothetical protein
MAIFISLCFLCTLGGTTSAFCQAWMRRMANADGIDQREREQIAATGDFYRRSTVATYSAALLTGGIAVLSYFYQ